MESKNRVPAVERAFDILEYLMSRNEALSIKEISEDLTIPNATVFRIVKSLESKGYVYKKEIGGKYILGARAVSFGSSVNKESNLSQIANAFMYELAKKSGQTVQLGVLFEYQIMYIDQIRTTDSLIRIEPTREPFEVDISAGGKVMVAYLSEEKQKKFLAQAVLSKHIRNSDVARNDFSRELVEVKSQGYAIDDEEFARGIRCIAAPIFNNKQECIASLGITGHTLEISLERMDYFIQLTIDVAKKVSKALRL